MISTTLASLDYAKNYKVYLDDTSDSSDHSAIEASSKKLLKTLASTVKERDRNRDHR